MDKWYFAESSTSSLNFFIVEELHTSHRYSDMGTLDEAMRFYMSNEELIKCGYKITELGSLENEQLFTDDTYAQQLSYSSVEIDIQDRNLELIYKYIPYVISALVTACIVLAYFLYLN